ncbi:MAG: hypothetical protein HY710_09355 [Candidatus Latescibacteria bacterium]|nr:hypothetical protein [Candidatus Latescibacterota bacterium]
MLSNPEHTWGHTIPFGEAYYQNAVKLLQDVRGEAKSIAGVSAIAADALRAGRTVYANITAGHMPKYELVNEREGNPALFTFIAPNQCPPESFAAMQAGDVLLTNYVGEPVRAARDRGVYVVVVTTYYYSNRHTPPGKLPPNPHDWMPEDVASRVIDSHIPWSQGLVHAPEIPEMPICPGSSNVTCTIHWMITAEVAHAIATGHAPNGRVGRQYVDLLLERIADVYAHDLDRLNAAAVTIARRIIGGGHYYVRSRNMGVQSESQGVAQGLMLTNAFDPRPASEGGDRDVFLIAAVSPNDPQELAWADEARANGNYLVGIGPSSNDGLRDRCDVYVDDRCQEPAGVIPIPGRPEPVCPATGILNNLIMYMLTAQFVDEMCRRGAVPYFWMGFYRLGGREYSDIMRPFFLERGY